MADEPDEENTRDHDGGDDVTVESNMILRIPEDVVDADNGCGGR